MALTEKRPTGISKVSAQFIGRVAFEPKKTPEGELGIFISCEALNRNRQMEPVLIKLIIKGRLAQTLSSKELKVGDKAIIRGRNPTLVRYRDGVNPAFMMPCSSFNLIKEIENDVTMNISGHLAFVRLDPSQKFAIIVVATSPYEGQEPVFYEASLFTENRLHVAVGRRVDMEVHDCVPFTHTSQSGTITSRVHCRVGMLQLTDKKPTTLN